LRIFEHRVLGICRLKVACFELYRRNIRSPEILTFDELYYYASPTVVVFIEIMNVIEATANASVTMAPTRPNATRLVAFPEGRVHQPAR
jgi:hypothetical protein